MRHVLNLLNKSVIISVEVIAMKRFDLTDDMWKRIETALKKDKATWRGKLAEKRLFIEGVLSLLQNKKTFSTCLNWNNLDPKYGDKYSQCRKFNRWRNDGIWEKLLSLFAERSNYCWIAEPGTYEVLMNNGKSLIKINKIIKDNYDMEKENLNEDINNLMNENKILKDRLEQLENDIKEKDSIIRNLKKEKAFLIKGCYTEQIVQNKNNKIKQKIKEIADIRNENITLKSFNRIYINRLYSLGYKPSKKNTNQAFIDNFWSVAKTFKKEREKNKSTSISCNQTNQ